MTETVRFDVPVLEASAAYAGDLGNTLNSLSGVEGVQIDRMSRMITVTYDPAYVSPERLRDVIRKSGYPLRDAGDLS
jgi:copper chaperone CopZ